MDLETGLILRELRCLKKQTKTIFHFLKKSQKKGLNTGGEIFDLSYEISNTEPQVRKEHKTIIYSFKNPASFNNLPIATVLSHFYRNLRHDI